MSLKHVFHCVSHCVHLSKTETTPGNSVDKALTQVWNTSPTRRLTGARITHTDSEGAPVANGNTYTMLVDVCTGHLDHLPER